jgi:C1A family cysteine protease
MDNLHEQVTPPLIDSEGVTRATGLNATHEDVQKEVTNLISAKMRVKTSSQETLSVFQRLTSFLSPKGWCSWIWPETQSSTQYFTAITTERTEILGISNWPPRLVYNQGQLGSCTANAMAFCIRYLSLRNANANPNANSNSFSYDSPKRIDISRLYQYYNTRYYEGNIEKKNDFVRSDNGASMPGAILAIDKYGCCPEIFNGGLESAIGSFSYAGCQYDIDKFAEQPNPESYRFAFDPSYTGLNSGTAFNKKKITQNPSENPYSAVSQKIQYDDLTSEFYKVKNTTEEQKSKLVNGFKQALKNNKPIYCGVAIDDNFVMGTTNGFIKMPNQSAFKTTGGHAIVIVGYGNYNSNNPDQRYFKFINSWGPGWGDGGFGYLPEDYVANVNIFRCSAFAVDLQR